MTRKSKEKLTEGICSGNKVYRHHNPSPMIEQKQTATSPYETGLSPERQLHGSAFIVRENQGNTFTGIYRQEAHETLRVTGLE